MADVNASIGVNIDASNALAQIKSLQRQIASFHTSIAKSSSGAAQAQQDLQRNFINSINSISGFSAELRTVKTTAENFTSSLEKNKFSMREYFRYAGASTKTFGRLFRSEFDTINKVAVENVKRLQTQYIKMGRDASGAMRAIAIMPTELDMTNLTTKTQLAAQKQALFNQLVKQGSTNLLNFGKNTQWAGRQLMVGFTLPLITFGATATKAFMDMEAQALKFKKVYGDLFTTGPERQKALDEITALGQAFTKYGIAVSSTVGLAADAAAAGFQGIDLQRQTTEATRLQVLGQIDAQKALETTISLQNAFQMQSADLADSINFLNAVENQTVVSLDDITTAIPKAAPVVRQLGGDVKDLAFFMAAMKEGGINASEGANALKSGLASLINPTGKAKEMMSSFGIDIDRIVNKNAGNVKQTVIEFATALDGLSDLNRQRAIEQLFGKFQLARLSTLFENVTKSGNQASRVLDLATASTGDLAAMAEKELGMTADSAMNKFRKSVEDLKFALVPVGEVFLSVITPFIEKIGGLIEKFNGLSDTTKKVITFITVGIGAIAPVVLMTIGLIANFVANGIKGLMILRNGYLRLTGQSQILGEQTQYLTVEQQNALAAAHSLDQSHANLIQTFTVEAGTLNALKTAYERVIVAQNKFASRNPGMMVPGAVTPTKRAKGKPVVVGGTGNKDTELALLTPGETVIPSKMSKKYAGLINGMIAGNIPGYMRGKSASGMFTKSPSDVKKDKGLYSAPDAVADQTSTMEWSTLDAELEAIELATRGYLETLDLTAEQIQERINNLQRVQASHINKEVDTRTIGGEDLDIKQWNAANLQADLGSINNFLNVLPKIANTLDDSKIAELAGKLNITVDEFEAELSQLEEGIHPATQKSADVLLAVAQEGAATDPSTGRTKKIRKELENSKYQAMAAAATLETRRGTPLGTPAAGDYYVTLPDRAYDPAKDVKAAEQVASAAARTQQALLASFDISDEIAQISGKNKAALQNAWNSLTTEQKESLLALKNDANAFTSALLNEAKEAGVAGFELGDSAIQGISKGIQDGSPSKKAKQKGTNVVDGFEQGILEGMDDASIAGSQVGNAAVDSLATPGVASHSMGAGRRATRPQGPAPIGPSAPTGARTLPIVSAPLVAASEQIKGTVGVTSSRLGSLNKALNGVTLGLTSAAGAGTMFGGKIGELSTQIFKYSGLLFGLMQITQLLTGSQFARLVAERAATAGILTKTATDAVGGATFARTTGLFSGGIKKLLPNLFSFSKKLISMLGPWGKLAAITITVGSALWGLKKISDAQKEKVDGLGKAAFITGERLKTLGDIFGVVPKKFAFEDLPKTTGLGLTGAQRTKTQQIMESEDFQKNFAQNISSIKDATNKEAELLFKGLVVQLKARGFDKETVEGIVNAIKLESGKTDIELDFEKITILTPEGRAAVQKDIASMIKLAKTTRDIKAASGTLAGVIGATESAFKDGAISAQEYADQMSFINLQITSQPYPKGVELINSIFTSMDSTGVLLKTTSGIKNINDKLLVMNAIAVAGLSSDSPLIKGLSSTLWFVQNISRTAIDKTISDYFAGVTKGIAAARAEAEDLNDDLVSGDLSAASKKAIDSLNKEIKVLERKKKALQDVNNEIDRQQEFQIKQQQLDADMVQAKISGNYIQAALLGQQKLYNKSQYDRETTELDLERQIQALQDRIDAIEGGAKIDALGKKITKLEDKTKNPPPPPPAPPPPPTIQYGVPTKSRLIPDFKPFLKTALRKNNRVVFNPGTGKWEEIEYNSPTPNGFISTADWRAGRKTYANGGLIKGPGTGMSDSIKATFGYAGGGSIRVSNGEYIMRAKAVKDYGISTMDSINNGNASFAQNSGTVYNIDMTINGANANANDIANQVISKLKVISNKNNKSNMVVR